MPEIDVYLTARTATHDDLKGRSVLIIDVLRACSTIVTALNHGARGVIPVADMAEAGKIAAHMDEETMVMGGERAGVKIEGYQLGNSPQEYRPEMVQGRTVVLNTSNGTRAITLARGAAELAVGCFMNVSQAIRFVYEAKNDVAIICAGADRNVGLEDILCAGLILNQLWEGSAPADCSDAAHIAFSQYAHDRNRLEAAIATSNHARRLVDLGFEEDVMICSQVDTCDLLPVFRDNRLVLSDPSAAAYPSRVASSGADAA